MYGVWRHNFNGVKQGVHLLDRSLFIIPLIDARRDLLRHARSNEIDGYAISALALNSPVVYDACRYLFAVKKWKERKELDRYTFYG